MKPAFAYYGGKTRLAPWIVGLLPPHEVYVEPFAGSAAVLFAKPPVHHEVLNDIDGQVINFYRLLRERPDELEVACRLTPYARDEYLAADFDEPGIDDLERARRWWCRSTQGFGQSANGATGWSISTAQSTGRPYQSTARLDRFAAIAERLRHVFIESKPALDIIERFGADERACLYVDPPYLGDTRMALGQYRHEMQGADEHRALADALHGCRAAVVLSGYASPLYDEDLFAGWHRTERRIGSRHGNGKRSPATGTRRKHDVEVLWSNRPLDADVLNFGGAS
ncbi:MAG: DNA adenine methylase [Acidimicrobiales bacterium]|nr:DNA adenine methylase [Acidimicrobiales bacterium]MCB9376782.1 DNA adenine methylase [Microthrixaceae bacterium]